MVWFLFVVSFVVFVRFCFNDIKINNDVCLRCLFMCYDACMLAFLCVPLCFDACGMLAFLFMCYDCVVYCCVCVCFAYGD